MSANVASVATLEPAASDAEPGTVWLEVAGLVATCAIAMFLRFWKLDVQPPGIDLDEARNGVEALGVLAGAHPMFFTTFDPREPLFIYSLSLLVRLLGPTVVAMRITAAVWALAGVGLTYLVARQWFGRRVALLATAGTAGSLWLLAMSRWAERDLTLPSPLLLFLFFFWRGFERRSLSSFALAGAFASLCAYAYVAARILPVFILILLIAQLLVAPRSVSANIKGLFLALVTAAAVIAPLALYFASNPSALLGRVEQISSLGRALPGVAPEPVWQTTARTLGMFFVSGDANWRDGIPYRPVFEWWLAIPFCLGVIWALRHALKPATAIRERLGERRVSEAGSALLCPCLWLLLWQLALLFPGFLSRPSPQFDRTIGAAPSTYILLALGLVASCTWTGRHSPHLGNLAWLIAGGLLVLLCADTYRAYFGSWARADPPVRVFEYGQVFDARFLNERQPPPEQTVVFLGYQSSTAIRYLAPRYANALWMEDFSQLLPVPSRAPATYVFAGPSLGGAADPVLVQRYVPDAALLAKDSFPGSDPAAAIFEVSEAQLAARMNRAIGARFGDSVVLEAVSASSAQQPARRGEELRLTLSWRVLVPSRDNYSAFVHVVGGDGKVVAQHDRQGVPTNGWEVGQQFLSAHVFPLPEGSPPGAYRVLAGIERRTETQPSQSLGELGSQVEVLQLEVSG